MKKNLIFLMVATFMISLLAACGGSGGDTTQVKETKKEEKKEMPTYDKVDGVAVDMENKGVGPVTSVTLAEQIDEALAAQGHELYDIYCLACHNPTKKFIGPAPKDILDRRSPEWVMNMILDPERMVEEDPVARQLLIEYNGTPMANQSLTEEEARAILEYFRTL